MRGNQLALSNNNNIPSVIPQVVGSEEVAVAALYFEVQRSSQSEAKKEELRRQELEQMRERDDSLSREVESLKSKIQELEQLARGRGLAGVFNFRPSQVEEGKVPTPA
ncbi:hypothetical protein KY289_014552 [Solanum tuberosum]|nr:hypothetical protein KY289_014552 [Solanum tuberosum]